MNGLNAPDAAGTDADLVRAFLSARDAPCPGCGYNLRGIAAGRCPECERQVALCIEGGAVQPRVRTEAFVLLCVILIALMGQIAIWLLSGVWPPGMPSWYIACMLITVGAYALEGAALLRLIVAVRRSGGAASDGRVLRWAMVWLGVHAAVACISLAISTLFIWIL